MSLIKSLLTKGTIKTLCNISEKRAFITLFNKNSPLLRPTPTSLPYFQTNRFKGRKKKEKSGAVTSDLSSQTESESVDDLVDDKNTKTLKINAPSMRLDAILKSALGLSRNKIEVIFYENKIRVNGEKVPKKSINLQTGDEVDVIKGFSNNNSDLLTVAKIEILTTEPKEESYSVKIRRCKSLIVDNYKGYNAWKDRG